MAKIRITKEELAQDPVAESTQSAIQWIKDNINLILGVVIIGLLAYTGYTYWHNKTSEKTNQANARLADVVKKYDEGGRLFDWATEERTKAMKEVIAMANSLRTDYPDTPIARQALFISGNAYFIAGDTVGTSGNTEDAIEAFQRYVAEAKTPFERSQGNLALGYANENAFFLTNQDKFLKDAVTGYKNAQNEKSVPFLRGEAMLAEARLLAFTGQKDEAVKLYREIMTERPIEPMKDGEKSGRDMIKFIKGAGEQYSITQRARTDLLGLGVDVDKEYPLEPEAK